jgi:hypothetical protein
MDTNKTSRSRHPAETLGKITAHSANFRLENYLLQDLGLHRGEIRYLQGDLNHLDHRHE